MATLTVDFTNPKSIKKSYDLKKCDAVEIKIPDGGDFLEGIDSATAKGAVLTVKVKLDGGKTKTIQFKNVRDNIAISSTDYENTLQGFYYEPQFGNANKTWLSKPSSTSVTGTAFGEEIDVSTAYVPTSKNLKKKVGVKINAGAGNDTIIGTQYKDTYTGGLGEDTFVYNGGVDTITDATKDDVIVIGDDYYIEDFTFIKNGNNLEIVADNENKIVVKNHFKLTADKRIDTLISGEDEFSLAEQDYIVSGKGKLVGTEYNDLFTSSKSNDTITGKKGVNVVQFSGKFGKDTVNLTEGENLILDFSGYEDFYDWNVVRRVSGNNLVITIRDWNSKGKIETLGTVTIKNFAKENVVGDEGSVILRLPEEDINLNDIELDVRNVKSNYKGTRFDEYIEADYATKAITITGGQGDDYIVGNAGNGKKAMTFTFSAGDGDDRIYDTKANDVIRIDTAGEITYENKGGDLLIGYGNGDSILVSGYYLAEDDERIDTLKVKKAGGGYETVSLAEETDVEEYKKHVLNLTQNVQIELPADTPYTTINFVGYIGDTDIYTYGPEYHWEGKDDNSLYIEYGNGGEIILKDFFVNKGHPTKYVSFGGETYDMMRRFYTEAKADIVAPRTEDWLYMSGGDHTVTFTENNYYHIYDRIYSDGNYTDTLVLDDYSFRDGQISIYGGGSDGNLSIDADDGIDTDEGGRRNHIIYTPYPKYLEPYCDSAGIAPAIKIVDKNGTIDIDRADETTTVDWSSDEQKNKDHVLAITNTSNAAEDETVITVNSGQKRNQIVNNSDGNAVLNYTYKGGNDTVYTDGKYYIPQSVNPEHYGYFGADDTYNVESFNATTKLSILDYGGIDNDTININAYTNDIYILFGANDNGMKHTIKPDINNTGFVHKDAMTVETLKAYFKPDNYNHVKGVLDTVAGVANVGGNSHGSKYDEDLRRNVYTYGATIENVKTIDNQDGLDIMAWKNLIAGRVLNWLENNSSVEGENLWFHYMSIESVFANIESGRVHLTDAQYESLLDCYKIKYSEIPESKTFASTTGNDNFEFGTANNTVTYSNQAMGKDTLVSNNEEYNASYKDRIIFADDTNWTVKDGTLDVDVNGNDLVIGTDEDNNVTYKNFVSDENHNEVILIDSAKDKYYLSTVTTGSNFREGSNNIAFVYNDENTNSVGGTTGRNFIYSYGEKTYIEGEEGVEVTRGMWNCVYRGGEDTVVSYSTTGSDGYEVFAFDQYSKLNVTDMGGDNDSLYIGYTSPSYNVEVPIISDVRFVFDVDADGAVYDDFMLVHKNALSGTTLHNTTQGDLVNGVLRYNATPTVEDSFGIETFKYFESYDKVDDTYPYVRVDIDIDAWKDEIVQNVQGWLTAHNDYESAYDAFENCNDADALADLVACYNVDYTQLNQG